MERDTLARNLKERLFQGMPEELGLQTGWKKVNIPELTLGSDGTWLCSGYLQNGEKIIISKAR